MKKNRNNPSISEKLLAERKKRLAKKFKEISPHNSHYIFSLGEMWLAIPLRDTRAIASLKGANQLHQPPFLPTNFLGLIRYNFSLVHLINLPALLGEAPLSPPLYALIFCHQSFFYAIPIYSRGEKLPLYPTDISPSSHSFLSGQIQQDERSIWVVDLPKLVECLDGESIIVIIDE